jgi:peptide deformylase
MSTRPVRIFGDPVLRSKANQVVDFDAQLRHLVRDLHETLYDQRGYGLAATQLGVLQRVFVWHQSDGTEGHLVNPVLEFPDEEEQDGPEGCLSIPGLYFDTKRRLNTVAKGSDMHGRPVQIVGTEKLARCFQHETDHLDGVLFIDRLDAETRKAAMKAIREAPWGSSPAEGSLSAAPAGASAAGGSAAGAPGLAGLAVDGAPVVKVSPHTHAGPNHQAHGGH